MDLGEIEQDYARDGDDRLEETGQRILRALEAERHHLQRLNRVDGDAERCECRLMQRCSNGRLHAALGL